MTIFMHYSRFLSCLFITAIAVATSACKVEGPEGPAGRDGLDGNANVKTQIITVTPSAWVGDGYVYQAQRPCSIITAEIVNSGAVLCYMQDANNTYIPLPFTFTNWYPAENGQPILYNSHTLFFYSPGVISFLIQDDDAMTSSPEDNVIFKVVAIASSEVVAGLDTRDYRQVATVLQLED